ncbi:hypothetical protein Poli38472_002283 [Pythium oligandrum]|uniref:Uncharacterized protein n=1 Tax=Pythium oligandrum TaxID=41045 RepID=A0A8K1CJH0_PYTOL|nr:hypothetical protein Poli38472_002283 [Pythium oligandrum]|eukprot:TMW63342.1 hypothetical protein Poli38472_002283 [Pythium oligandrum]
MSSPASIVNLTPLEAAEVKDQEADECIALGDLDGALQALHKAIYFRPDHAPLHAKLARVYWDLCDLKSAMASYRKLFAVDRNPSQRIKDQFAALLDLHAYSLLTLGETPTVVIAYLTEAIQLNGLDETYWLHRALAHIQAQSYEKALKDVDHCVNLNGKEVEYFVLRAKLHWKLHVHDRATNDIHRAAALEPLHPEVIEHAQRLRKESEAIYARACQHLITHEFAEAIKCLTSAAEIAPEETKIYMARASAYRELSDFTTALKDVDKAMSCHKKRFEAAQKQRNQVEQSNTDLTKENREISTMRILILNDMALQCLRNKSYQVALTAMNQVIRGDLELRQTYHEAFCDPQYHVNRGDAYRGLSNFQAALADYHHALELLPDSQDVKTRVALVHYQFGIDLFNQARFDKAELEFIKAIEQDGNVSEYHVRKGDSARFQEKHDVACVDYQNALALNPSDDEICNKLRQYSIETTPMRRPAKNERPKPQKQDEETLREARSAHSASPTALEQALASYQKKNKVVKDLFHQRPTLPPATKRPT